MARRGPRDLRMIPDGERSAALDPYPFAGGPLTVSAPARRIPARRYADAEDLAHTLAATPPETLTFTFHPA